MNRLVTIKPLSEQIGVPVRTIRTLQAQRKVSYIRAGHRTVLFDPAEVVAELERLKVKAVH